MKNIIKLPFRLIGKAIKKTKYLVGVKNKVHTVYILIIAIHYIYGYAYITGSTFYEEYVNQAQAQVVTTVTVTNKEPTVGSVDWIREQWEEVGANWNEVWAVIQAESRWNSEAWNCNTNKSLDLGIYQINLSAHPEVSVECALDAVCSTKYAIGLWKKQGWSPWYGAQKIGLW